MKIWVFPSKEFIKYEMKKSMENEEFPGSSEENAERQNEDGPTEQEKEMIKQNERFMDGIREISEKYNGNLDGVIQIKDYENNEVLFNLYVKVNEEDILTMKPLPPEKVPEEDVRIEIDFEKIYELVQIEEKEMRSERIEYPPWDKQSNSGGFKEVRNGVKMYFKITELINSAKIYPEESEKDVKDLFRLFLRMAIDGGQEEGQQFEKEFNEENFAEEVELEINEQ